ARARRAAVVARVARADSARDRGRGGGVRRAGRGGVPRPGRGARRGRGGGRRTRRLHGRAALVAARRAARGLELRPDAAVRLVAVVLNWNGAEDTPRALASLARIETICVDNGSAPGS